MVEPVLQLDDMDQIPCDLCGSDDNVLVLVKEGFRHVRCRQCSLVFVNPRLRGHLEGQRVSGTGAMGEDRLTPAQARRLRKELRAIERFRVLNRILEVGPGRGWFLEEAAGAGWETWAVEVNVQALAQLEKRPIQKIIVQPAECFDAPPGSFDAVRMWDVIEHLQSPFKALTRIHHVLRNGGVLRLATTNFASLSRWVNGPEWVYLNGSDHIYLFEPGSIARLLFAVGFQDVRIHTRSFNLRRKRYHPETDLPPPRSMLLPFRKIIDELIRLTPYGHQMIVTATKGARCD